MKRRSIWTRLLCMAVAMAMCLSTVPAAYAAETIEGQVMVETEAGSHEQVDVTITIDTVQNPDGSTTTQTTTETNDFVTEKDLVVDYSGSSTTLTAPNGEIIQGEAEGEYTVSNPAGTQGADGGFEITAEPVAPEVELDVPLTDTDDPNTEEVENQNTANTDRPAGTVIEVTGDKKESEEDGEYDYTATIVEKPGSVTVTTEEITITETSDTANTDMEYIYGDVEATPENDMIEAGLDSEWEVQDGYTHVYLGEDRFSGFAAALVCREGAPGEEPVFIKDGIPYYVQAGHNVMENRKLYVDDYYIDGEHIEEKTYARWDYIQQFALIDAETGELVTVYCADQKTTAQGGYSYIMENVEDANYYSQEQAEKIRSVALNGYWGTTSGTGSLEEMKAKLAASGAFTEAELAMLTDGMAMTATQYAIWNFSNVKNGDRFINVYQATDTGKGAPSIGRVPEEEQASVELIFKLYDYLVNLEPTKSENTTADTIINEQNFLKDMSLTVLDKAQGHANNQDTDTTNDAYVTNLTFALVVTPSTDNGDDLVVSVVDKDGNVVASGRIAGEAREGETVLTPDDEGNYSFTGITLIEGKQNFHITLEGIQNLEEGVYLYSSEVRTDETGDQVESQTMVGLASGSHGVNVSMNIEFDVSVEDEVIVTERVWREEWEKPSGGNPPEGNPPDKTPPEDVPPEDSGEPETVVQAKPPKTGDGSLLYSILSALSGMGLSALQLLKKRKKAVVAEEVQSEAQEQPPVQTEPAVHNTDREKEPAAAAEASAPPQEMKREEAAAEHSTGSIAEEGVKEVVCVGSRAGKPAADHGGLTAGKLSAQRRKEVMRTRPIVSEGGGTYGRHTSGMVPGGGSGTIHPKRLPVPKEKLLRLLYAPHSRKTQPLMLL